MATNISSIYSDTETQYFKNELKTAIQDFMLYTESEDYLGIILRAQLYIEKNLDILLNKLLIHPNKISLQFFSSKLDAAYALGAIEDDWYFALQKFNKIRNKYAHDFKYKFTENEYTNLVSTLSKDAKNEYINNIHREEWAKQIISSITNTNSEPLTLKYKLRILLSDFMLYVMQQHQSFAYLWKEINLTKEQQILNEREILLSNLKETQTK